MKRQIDDGFIMTFVGIVIVIVVATILFVLLATFNVVHKNNKTIVTAEEPIASVVAGAISGVVLEKYIAVDAGENFYVEIDSCGTLILFRLTSTDFVKCVKNRQYIFKKRQMFLEPAIPVYDLIQ